MEGLRISLTLILLYWCLCIHVLYIISWERFGILLKMSAALASFHEEGKYLSVCVCVCVRACVRACVQERDRERESAIENDSIRTCYDV